MHLAVSFAAIPQIKADTVIVTIYQAPVDSGAGAG